MLSRLGVLIGILCWTMMTIAAAGDTRVADAAKRGDRTQVQALLKQKADVNGAQGDGSTALHWAAFREDVEMTRWLIEAGANANAKTRLGEITPIFMASENGNAAVIELLLKAGVDANSRNSSGATPLMMAAGSGSVNAVRTLLDKGADVNAKDAINGQTAVMFASALGRADAVRLLSSRGADLSVTSLVPQPVQRGGAPGASGGRPGRGPRVSTLGGMTALHFAAREGQTTAVHALVESGADVNKVTASDSMSPINTAIFNGHFDIARYLLDRGADPKLTSAGGLTPLYAVLDSYWAARTWYPAPSVEQEKTSHLDLMKALLDKGADPNVKMGPKMWIRSFHGDWADATGATPFWRAAQSNDIPAMRLLVAYGADPNIRSTAGLTPLQVAAGFGIEPQVTNFAPDARLNALKYLIEELGADVNAKDNKGYTALHGAGLVFGDTQIIQYLVARGADVKARANMVFGREDAGNADVPEGTGDTVADMANGPRAHNLVYQESLDLLVKLGAVNTDNCRASICVNKTLPTKQQ